jgi:hypothetical protein
MTFDMAQFIAGCVLLSLAIGYACWTRIRVWLLREDFFVIRDELWDKARELGALDHPEHRAARHHLNACIRAAHLISVPVLIRFALASEGQKSACPDTPSDDNPELTRAMEHARRRLIKRVGRYLVVERPLSALIYICAMGTWFVVRTVAARFVNSSAPEELSQVDDAYSKRSPKKLVPLDV